MTAKKQPAHEDAQEAAKRTVDKLNELTKDLNPGEARGPSGKRENNPTPIEDRVAGPGPASTAALDAASGAISGARANLEAHESAEARLKSDPRHERDQEVYSMGQAGTLGYVPPSAAELAASGVSPEVLKELPKNADEQNTQDMERLNKGKEAAEAATVQPGEQEGAAQNNFTRAKEEGKNTGERVPNEKEFDKDKTKDRIK